MALMTADQEAEYFYSSYTRQFTVGDVTVAIFKVLICYRFEVMTYMDRIPAKYSRIESRVQYNNPDTNI